MSHAHRGSGWESYVEFSLGQYEKAGLLAFHRIDTGSRAVRAGDHVRLVPVKAPPDFMATLAGGRSLVLDAKSTAQKAWRLDDAVVHQWRFMQRFAARGALCLFLIECRPLRSCAALRILAPPLDPHDKPALRFLAPGENVRPLAIMPFEPGAQVDWLSPVLDRWARAIDDGYPGPGGSAERPQVGVPTRSNDG